MAEYIEKSFFGLSVRTFPICEQCGIGGKGVQDLIFTGFQAERGKSKNIWFCDPCLLKKIMAIK